MTIGPREMAARKAVVGPLTIRDERRIGWARLEDGWSLACHNLHHATGDATRSMRKLAEALARMKAEHPDEFPEEEL